MSGFEFQEEDKREYRRRRRIRNQILAYVSLVLILAVVSVGGYFGIKALSGVVEEKQQQEQMEEALAAAQQVEEEMTEVSEVPEETVEETVVETVEEYTEEDLLNEVVESCISEMSLEDRVAGLFIVTPEALTGVDRAVKAGDGTKEALEKYPVGGLIYFKQNIQSKDQITEMLANTTAMSKYPIFLAVDEEGDSVAE